MFTFPSEPEEALFFTGLQKATNESSGSLGMVFAEAQLVGKIAKARIPDIAQHVSTPTVARDMLSIVKAFGLDKLQYWGFSYVIHIPISLTNFDNVEDTDRLWVLRECPSYLRSRQWD